MSPIDTTGHQPYPSGVLARIVAIHFPTRPVGIAEQGLLQDFLANVAIALDTGETFPGIAMGASGKLINPQMPFTVLTSGIVAYGKPAHGDACFMACTDGSTILRGHQDVGGDMEGIVWDSVTSVDGLFSLSFAGDGFFATYQTADMGAMDSGCVASFDGKSFSELGNLYAGVPEISVHDSLTPGSVASNSRDHATVGMFQTDPNYPNIIGADFNMIWRGGYTPNETSNPGIRASSLTVGHSSIYTTIAGGAGRFVATATKRNEFQSTAPVPGTGGEEFIKYVRPTAAAAVSSDGGSWTTVPLPGATEGSYIETGGGFYNIAESVAVSVVFVRTSGSAGYFLITANGFTQEGGQQSAESYCWKGDGSSWQMIKQAGNAGLATLSAIARDLSSTKIVYI